MGEICQSYIMGGGICRDGFPQSLACHGAKCHGCGSYTAERKPPACCQEEQTDRRWFDDAGMPKFAEYRKGGAA